MTRRPTFPIAVNVILFNDGKLLLGERIGGFGDKMWGLPGGHLEYGENLIHAAKRELLEETGLGVTLMRFSNLVNEVSVVPHYLHIGFYALLAEGMPQVCEPHKCRRWEWFEPNRLPREIIRSHAGQIWAFSHEVPLLEL